MDSAGSEEAPAITRFYGFLTTMPSTLVAPIHEKAMPVILATQDETGTWLKAPWSEAKPLQGTAPDDVLMIVEKPATQIKISQGRNNATGQFPLL